jgi:hypothetical protein
VSAGAGSKITGLIFIAEKEHMKHSLIVLAVLLTMAPSPLAAQAKGKPRPPKATPSPTAVPLSDDEKAAVSALRAYNSVRSSGDKGATQRYYLDTKVKVEQLSPSAIATKIQDAFAPTLRAATSRHVHELGKSAGDSMAQLYILAREYEKAKASRTDQDARDLALAQAEVEENRKTFPEFGAAYDAKAAGLSGIAKDDHMTASLISMNSDLVLESIGAERTKALAVSLLTP